MKIRVYRSASDKIEPLDFEEYLCGVVPAEIGGNAPFEALKAQAVACRTYAYRHILADKNKEYDVTDTTSNQVYKPNKKTELATKAVRETKGVIMVYKDKPIGAWYSSSNGGRIKSSAEKWGGSLLPYSVSKKDPYDKHGGGGHGVGLSQYGAMEMARQGFTYKEILEFYYNSAFEFEVLPYANTKVEAVKPAVSAPKTESKIAYRRLIKVLMRGDDVRAVKDRLVELGFLRKSSHNLMGYDSLKAVKAFQKANGLEVDGIVGPLTWEALF